jgi:ribosome maturation factor RimP
MSRADSVRALAEPIVVAQGLELYDVEEHSATIRVLVHGESGAGIADLAKITRILSDALDEDEPGSGSYTLEVSSPGVERPLRLLEHFEAAIGDEVTVKTWPGTDGDRRISGELTAVDTDGIELADDDGRVHRVLHDDISKARTVYDATADLKADRDRRSVPGSSDPNPSTQQKVDAS